MLAHLKSSTFKCSSLLLLALVSSSAFGQAKKAAAPPAQSQTQAQDQANEKMDVSDLEKKYWSAKDTDFNVVQNRLFSKAHRLALTLNTGMYVNEPWSKGLTYGASLNYFFNERDGIEFAYTKTDSTDNDATQSLKSKQGGAPNHSKMKGYYGLGFNWVPFYAKMSVLNSSIIYFDMSITPGVGMMQYQEQGDDANVDKTAPAASLTLTQHFFLTKWLALRFDYKNYWYNQEVIAYHAAGRGPATSSFANESLIMGGFTFYY